MRLQTRVIRSARQIDEPTGGVAQPIHLSTTFERDADGGYRRGYSYIRTGNPTRDALEAAMAQIEGGTVAAAFASGLAAASAVFMALKPGDRVIVPREVYHGLRTLLEDVLVGWGLRVVYVEMHDLDAVDRVLTDGARLVWIETPSNPLLRVTDIARTARIAHSAGAVCVCDNTFATPMGQRPIEHGADLVVHSTTKWIGGHSDMQGGCVIAKDDHALFARIRTHQQLGGAVPSPFDCWLALRGLTTLPCRVAASSASARAIAEFLERHPQVERTHYPTLPSHPDRAIAAAQMDSGGGIVSFEVAGGEPSAMRVAAQVKLFTRATSLGGVESLIEHRASIEGPRSTTPGGLLRLSIGLESADDLIDDLDAALRSG